MSTPRPTLPRPLLVAALVTALEGVVLLVLAGAELAHLSGERLTMGTSTTAFFAIFGVVVIAAAFAISRTQTWARGPVLLTQLIALGLAWSFRGTTVVVVALVLVAGTVLVGMLHPATIDALADDPTAP